MEYEEIEEGIDFSVKVENLELRSIFEIKKSFEIVQWFKDSKYCYTIAYWHRSKDGDYDLRFVGDRPFEKEVDSGIFMSLAKIGQELLNFKNRGEQE